MAFLICRFEAVGYQFTSLFVEQRKIPKKAGTPVKFVISHLAYVAHRHFTLFQKLHRIYHLEHQNIIIDKSGHVSSNTVAFVTGLLTTPWL
jgi:hypothetical protein